MKYENYTGPGWKSLIDPLIERCEAEGIKILQIKEKFGTLRFYTRGGSDALLKAIREAENKSETICELCGQPGRVRNDRWWVKTLCDEHDVEKEDG